jgi:hypothetical protein
VNGVWFASLSLSSIGSTKLLPPERGPRGQPSTVDFLLHEMPTIIDGLAQDYETVTAARYRSCRRSEFLSRRVS